MREAGYIVWNGNSSNLWDFGQSENFTLASDATATSEYFVTGDVVTFNDDATKASITLKGNLEPDSVIIDGSKNFTFSGRGALVGNTKLVKRGSGKLTINTDNTYTGGTRISGGTVVVTLLSNENQAYGQLGGVTSTASRFIIENGAELQTSGVITQGSPMQMVTADGGVINNAGDFVVNKPIGGTKLTKKGNGWMKLNVNNTVTRLVIAAGTVQCISCNTPAKTVEFQAGTLLENGGSSYTIDIPKGKSGTAKFLEGGFKVGSTLNIGAGHAATFGIGYEVRAPQASTAFVSPEVNNDFVTDLKLEKIFSMELGYQFQCPWLLANINGYYSTIKDATEWQVFYFDDINSLSYVSMTGINKHYYGVELGAKVKFTSYLDLNLIGTISDAKNTNNATAWYMSSNTGTYNDDNDHKAQLVYNKDMRESGTPLTALSAGLSFHSHGWYIDLTGNYYDRIYLSYSPSYRYATTLEKRQELYGDVYENGEIREDALAQAKGKGGFMLDGSIGKSIYLKKGGMLSINFMISNILNNTKICTGGWEQSRNDYSASGNIRTYSFANNPKKFYAWGTNGMINITYKF